jgi:D-alanine-D-alanine ligase
MKKKIALVTGGYSKEAVISYNSATMVNENIDKEKYEVYTIDIHPTGWWYNNINGEKIAVNKNDFSVEDGGNKLTFDAALMCIHGTPGEDGKLQSYFDLLKIPYTSCDAATSALTFNKRYTLAVAAFAGINTAKSLHLFKRNPVSVDHILQQLHLPVFVKPNNGGSSIGMSKVNQPQELQAALDKAFNEDDQVLIEEVIVGREFTVGVYKSKENITVLPITEIKTTREFFDYEAKYQGKSEEITPAVISDDIKKNLIETARKTYLVLNCRGVVRIDFIYNEPTQQPFMLEVNTVPGQSAESIVPQQVKAMGKSLQEFYSSLIEECFLQ